MTTNDPNQVIHEFCTLFNKGDVDTMAADLYEDDALIWPDPQAAPVQGKAAIADGLRGFLGLGGTLSILATTCSIQGDLALTHSRWRLDLPEGDPMEFTSAEVVRKQVDGTWRYAIDNPWGALVLG